ncbi:MAG TPA: hypothetical protein VMO17_10370 [Terriglobia bacterium]|nr:hypothetical protein [Terriglobia bacterium]HVN80521.1 hypothetical protein [Terriglobia bacterium]
MDPSNRKVIARLRDGNLVKGYLHCPSNSTFEDYLQAEGSSPPELIGIRPLNSGEDVSIPLEGLKALFFVRTFDGNKDYPELKFFDKSPPNRGLWVRVQFYDKEAIEGTIENSLRYVVERGFFMKPPDPRSNNEILYVIKSSLASFRVLGVRTDY